MRHGQNGSRADALHKIYSWAPKWARSYTIERVLRYEYGAFKIRRAYFSVDVEYYSRRGVGTYGIGEWDWKRYCLAGHRFPNLVKVRA